MYVGMQCFSRVCVVRNCHLNAFWMCHDPPDNVLVLHSVDGEDGAKPIIQFVDRVVRDEAAIEELELRIQEVEIDNQVLLAAKKKLEEMVEDLEKNQEEKVRMSFLFVCQ